jgi:hypothetical protein
MECEHCGNEQTHSEYAAVEPSTPAADQLGLGAPTQDDHHVVCESCFEAAVNELEDATSRKVN